MSTAWRQVKTLDEKMTMASEAAAQLDLLAQLPDTHHSTPYRPLSSNRLGVATPVPSHSVKDSNAMEIDAIQSAPRSILDSSRIICRSKNLCFRCLRPIVPGSHVGSLNCPNPPISMDQRKIFVDKARQTRSTQVAAIASTAETQSPSSTLAFQSASFPTDDSPTVGEEICGFSSY
ncbi:uncharacterized protein VP01_403g1 [Puccinia sorghi]|uniref:Uncharacterized protein n=1 Tax=Puccinia sorghi TaxID=27349 RepID=A0A0L6USK2_9BASI|nr:uncharacterized protein VP01_403g1 [Puccinia sorghi]